MESEQTQGTPSGQPAAVVTPVSAPAPETQPDKSGQAVTFTQEEVNSILAQRLKRAEDAATKRILDGLGVGSLDDLKTAITSVKAADDAKKTEVQKLQEKLDAEVAARKQAEIESQQLKENAKITARNTEISKALTAANAKKVDDLMILLTNKAHAEVEAVTMPDGKVEAKAIEALVKKAQADFAEFFGSAAPGSPSNARGKQQTDDAAVQRALAHTQRFARF